MLKVPFLDKIREEAISEEFLMLNYDEILNDLLTSISFNRLIKASRKILMQALSSYYINLDEEHASEETQDEEHISDKVLDNINKDKNPWAKPENLSDNLKLFLALKGEYYE